MKNRHIDDVERSHRIQLALVGALERIFTPLARIIVRHRIPCRMVEEALRRCMVKVAYEEHHRRGERNTIARVSMLTGVPPQEVERIVNDEKPGPAQVSWTMRLVEAWRTDEQFLDEQGEPLVLPVKGPGRSFEELTRAYTSAVPPRTMLAELVDAGTVEHDADSDTVKLIRRAYIPSSPDEPHMLEMMGVNAERSMVNMAPHRRGSADAPWYEQTFAIESLPPGQAAELLADLDRIIDEIATTVEAYEEGLRIDEYHRTVGIGTYSSGH